MQLQHRKLSRSVVEKRDAFFRSNVKDSREAPSTTSFVQWLKGVFRARSLDNN